MMDVDGYLGSQAAAKQRLGQVQLPSSRVALDHGVMADAMVSCSLRKLPSSMAKTSSKTRRLAPNLVVHRHIVFSQGDSAGRKYRIGVGSSPMGCEFQWS